MRAHQDNKEAESATASKDCAEKFYDQTEARELDQEVGELREGSENLRRHFQALRERLADRDKQLVLHADFISDLAAYVRFASAALEKDAAILSTLVHDIIGAEREGLDGCFSPRVAGYARREAKLRGEAR